MGCLRLEEQERDGQEIGVEESQQIQTSGNSVLTPTDSDLGRMRRSWRSVNQTGYSEFE